MLPVFPNRVPVLIYRATEWTHVHVLRGQVLCSDVIVPGALVSKLHVAVYTNGWVRFYAVVHGELEACHTFEPASLAHVLSRLACLHRQLKLQTAPTR